MIHCISIGSEIVAILMFFSLNMQVGKETIATLVINREKCPWHSSTVYSSIKTYIKI
jgi:hypothetical protein